MANRKSGLKNACKEYEEDLVLYYYGENNDAERRRVGQHLAACERCRLFVEDLHRLLPQMAKAEEMPQSFWDNYCRETMAKLAEQEERRNRWRSWLAPARTWMVPAFGTVAGMVLVVGLLFGQGNLGYFLDRASRSIPEEIIADRNQLEFFKTMDMLESLEKLEYQDGASIELNTVPSSMA
jgi:predicted anti-sigma-YlaC factor YlaD